MKNEYKTTCDCKPRDVEVVVRKANYSAFGGYRRTPSDYSEVRCRKCGMCWRTKAKYVDSAPDAPDAVETWRHGDWWR